MRKKFNILILLFFCGLLYLNNAHAAETPTQTITASIEKIFAILKDPNYQDVQKRPTLRTQIEKEIDVIFDFTEFSARTIGSYWASFTNEQKQRFEKAFSELLILTYLNQINGYNGEQVNYISERLSSDAKRAEVNTSVTLATKKIVPVDYRLIHKNNTWEVYDVLIENVGLNSNYRSQFKEILIKNNADQLIAKIEERVLELKQEAK